MKLFKRLFFTIILILCVIFTGYSASFNYGEALQKSIFFYEAQQAGPLPSWNRVEWRGDATMNDGVLGGLYDAGDHVKFNLPMSYTASTLGWAVYEYRSAFEASGQMQHIENNITFILDYLMACSSGTYVYQVGNGNNDHSWWGPVEVLHLEPMAGDRPSYSSSTGISCVMAQSAAALAIGAELFGNSSYLSRAQSLYSSALASKSDSVYKGGAAANFYNSWSGPIDELLWAAIWLYIATGNSTYLSDAESLVQELNIQPNTGEDVIEYRWGHCWDDVHYGAMILLARLTNKREYMDYVEMHLDWWTVGYNGDKITTSPGGLAICDSWGTLRHATTTAFIAFVYADWVTDATLKDRYRSFAERQINYALGDNPRNSSYMIGFGNNPPKHPHHRTAHGSWSDSMNDPPNHRHILYGALVGGADASDSYKDEISDYVMNEVACDYNAGFVGGLAKMYDMYGGTPLANFPQPEEKGDEFFMAAELTSSGTNSVSMKLEANNRSAWPARTAPNLKFRYFMDLSEVFAAGSSASSISKVSYYSEFPNTISNPIQFSGNIYYIEVVFADGNQVYPGGNSEHAGEVQLIIEGPSGAWDNSNDPSFKGFGGADGKNSAIVMYDGDTIIWGQEPGAPDPTTPPINTSAPTSVPTTAPTTTPAPTTAPEVLKGDANSDGTIDIVDALLIAQFYVGLTTSINEEASDVNCDDNIDIVDALLVAQYYVELISGFNCL